MKPFPHVCACSCVRPLLRCACFLLLVDLLSSFFFFFFFFKLFGRVERNDDGSLSLPRPSSSPCPLSGGGFLLFFFYNSFLSGRTGATLLEIAIELERLWKEGACISSRDIRATAHAGYVQRERGGGSNRPSTHTHTHTRELLCEKEKKTHIMAPPEAASAADAEPLSTEAVQKKSIRELTLRSVKRTYEMFDGHHTIRPPMHEARCVKKKHSAPGLSSSGFVVVVLRDRPRALEVVSPASAREPFPPSKFLQID